MTCANLYLKKCLARVIFFLFYRHTMPVLSVLSPMFGAFLLCGIPSRSFFPFAQFRFPFAQFRFPFAPFFFFHSLRSVYHSPLWAHICAQFRSAKLRPYAPHMPTWQCRLLRQLVGQSHCPLVLSLPPSCSSGITCASVSHKSNLTPQRVRNQSLPKDHRKIPQGSPKDEQPFLHKSRSHCIYTMYIYIFCYKVAINSTIYHPLVFLYPRTNLLFNTFLLEKCKKMQKYLVNSKKSSNFAAVLCA